MIRVLHLTNPQPDYQTTRAVEALTRPAGPAFESTWRPVRGLLAEMRSRRRGAEPPPDVVHAWGGRALAAAVLAGPHRVVFSPTRFPTPRLIRWLRSAMSHRDVQVVCSTATQRRRLVESGVPLDRCHLVRPGVDFAQVRRRRDPELRRRLGLADEDHVVLAPGESTRGAAHEDAVWAAATAHFLDPHVKLLLWGRGDRAGAAARRAAAIGGPGMFHSAVDRLGASTTFESLLPAADSVLVTARGPVPTLPIAVCMAAGLPIVSTVTYTVAELLEDRHTALMVPRHQARLLARRLLELRDDPQTQWSIADVARTEAYEYFSLTRFLDQFRGVYRQVADGKPVEVVEPQPGAGRRFHGRV